MSNYDQLLQEEKGITDRWTEQEMIDWIKSLSGPAKDYMLDIVKKAREAGCDVHYNCCVHRLKIEQFLEQTKKKKKSAFWTAIDVFNGITEGIAKGKITNDINLGRGIKIRT